MQGFEIHDKQVRNGHRSLSLHLRDILRFVKVQLIESSWHCRNVDYIGRFGDDSLPYDGDAYVAPVGEDFCELAFRERTLSGAELNEFALAVMQVIDGEFAGYKPEEAEPWIVIRAIDSSFWGVFSEDAEILRRIGAAFHDVREAKYEADFYDLRRFSG